MAEPPIEEVLDDLIPDWREQTRKLADEGYSDAEIVEGFQRQLSEQMDGLLDFYNALGEKED